LSKLARKIVPVVWNYRENVEISEDVFKKLAKKLKKIKKSLIID
jgi:hypothetical protein